MKIKEKHFSFYLQLSEPLTYLHEKIITFNSFQINTFIVDLTELAHTDTYTCIHENRVHTLLLNSILNKDSTYNHVHLYTLCSYVRPV